MAVVPVRKPVVRVCDTFWDIYERCCFSCTTGALPIIKRSILDDVSMELNLDVIKLEDWPPFFLALDSCSTMESVTLYSNYRGPVFKQLYKDPARPDFLAVKSIMKKLCLSLSRHMTKSTDLRSLSFKSIKFNSTDLTTLGRGFQNNDSIEFISFHMCPMKDRDVSALCKSLQKSLVKHLTLDECDITSKGAGHVATLIARQHSQRIAHLSANRIAEIDPFMGGIRRITLNNNMRIGDKGVKHLFKKIILDRWLRAIDLKACGLTEKCGHIIFNSITKNLNIIVVDIRSNGLNRVMENSLIGQLLIRQDEESALYPWIPEMTRPLILGQSMAVTRREDELFHTPHAKRQRISRSAEREEDCSPSSAALVDLLEHERTKELAKYTRLKTKYRAALDAKKHLDAEIKKTAKQLEELNKKQIKKLMDESVPGDDETVKMTQQVEDNLKRLKKTCDEEQRKLERRTADASDEYRHTMTSRACRSRRAHLTMVCGGADSVSAASAGVALRLTLANQAMSSDDEN